MQQRLIKLCQLKVRHWVLSGLIIEFCSINLYYLKINLSLNLICLFSYCRSLSLWLEVCFWGWKFTIWLFHSSSRKSSPTISDKSLERFPWNKVSMRLRMFRGLSSLRPLGIKSLELGTKGFRDSRSFGMVQQLWLENNPLPIYRCVCFCKTSFCTSENPVKLWSHQCAILPKQKRDLIMHYENEFSGHGLRANNHRDACDNQ